MRPYFVVRAAVALGEKVERRRIRRQSIFARHVGHHEDAGGIGVGVGDAVAETVGGALPPWPSRMMAETTRWCCAVACRVRSSSAMPRSSAYQVRPPKKTAAPRARCRREEAVQHDVDGTAERSRSVTSLMASPWRTRRSLFVARLLLREIGAAEPFGIAGMGEQRILRPDLCRPPTATAGGRSLPCSLCVVAPRAF